MKQITLPAADFWRIETPLTTLHVSVLGKDLYKVVEHPAGRIFEKTEEELIELISRLDATIVVPFINY